MNALIKQFISGATAPLEKTSARLLKRPCLQGIRYEDMARCHGGGVRSDALRDSLRVSLS